MCTKIDEEPKTRNDTPAGTNRYAKIAKNA